MAESELIRIKFDGGLATSGQLHFYEYSRSQYATARFIATIEHFRRTSTIAERITISSNVDIIVRSPQQGSFIEDLLVPAIKDGMAAAISTPLSSLISYVWHLLAPRSQKADEAVNQYAQIRLAELRADERRGEQQIEQLRILQKIVEGERATAQQALDLAASALQTGNVAIGRLGYSQQEQLAIKDELQAEVQREKEFEAYQDQLEQVDEEKINRLTSRLRPMVSEMALPLRRSADKMSISHGTKESVYAHIDQSIVSQIQSRNTEEDIVEVVGHVRSYDRDSGVGKVTSDQLLRVLNFSVPPGDRRRLRDKVLDAMRKEKVILLCRRILDESGLPTSLILVDVKIVNDG